jgi:hypothetical protein
MSESSDGDDDFLQPVLIDPSLNLSLIERAFVGHVALGVEESAFGSVGPHSVHDGEPVAVGEVDDEVSGVPAVSEAVGDLRTLGNLVDGGGQLVHGVSLRRFR